MFGSAKKASNQTPSSVQVATMPSEFYGGANPVVRFKNVEKVVEKYEPPELTVAEKRILDQKTAVGSESTAHPVHFFSNTKKVVAAAGVMFVVSVGATSWYYWHQAIQAHQQAVVIPTNQVPETTQSTQPTTEAVTPVVVATTTVDTATSTPSSVPDVSDVTTKDAISFPSMQLGSSTDADTDRLSDAEEELFGSDPSKPDTDGDRYFDGSEVYHLYNPGGKEPMRLVDSGTVKDYENPAFGYKVYYPKNWALGNTDSDFRDVLFSTITGEYVQIKVFDKPADQSFEQWFAVNAPRERFGDLTVFESVFKESGYRRSDELVYYFPSPTRVYVLLYATTDSLVVNYRQVIAMMARSFRLSENTESVPVRESSVITTTSAPLVLPTSSTVSTTTL